MNTSQIDPSQLLLFTRAPQAPSSLEESDQRAAWAHLTRALDPAQGATETADSPAASTPSPDAAAASPAPNLDRPEGSDVLVFDSFTQTEDDLANGEPAHGQEVVNVAGEASTDEGVEVYSMQAPEKAADWPAALSAVADYAPPPEVLNISMGMSPAALFWKMAQALETRFINTFGPKELWSETLQAQFRGILSTYPEIATTEFQKEYEATSEAIKEALGKLVAKGTTVVIAAGNEGEAKALLDQLEMPQDNSFYSGCYSGDLPPGVIFVGASESNDPNSAPSKLTTPLEQLDVAADGMDVVVTPEGITASGTSFSAPQISGLVGDMKAIDPSLNPAQIEQILIEASSRQEGSEMLIGAGVVDPEKARALTKQRMEERLALSVISDNFATVAKAGDGLYEADIEYVDLLTTAQDTNASAELRGAAQYLIDHSELFWEMQDAWSIAPETGNRDIYLSSGEVRVWMAEHAGYTDPQFVAINTLKKHFTRVESSASMASDGFFNQADLTAIINDPLADPKVRKAAEYVSNNPELFDTLDNLQSSESDGFVSYEGLADWEWSYSPETTN